MELRSVGKIALAIGKLSAKIAVRQTLGPVIGGLVVSCVSGTAHAGDGPSDTVKTASDSVGDSGMVDHITNFAEYLEGLF